MCIKTTSDGRAMTEGNDNVVIALVFATCLSNFLLKKQVTTLFIRSSVCILS